MLKFTCHINLIRLLAAGIMILLAQPLMASESVDYYSVSKGGRLYDKWYRENGSGTPKQANKAYPEEGSSYGKKGGDWRCKECHGWDYIGNKGNYSKGKHYTGFTGTLLSTQHDLSVIKNELASQTHNKLLSKISEDDIGHLVNFLKYGQVNMDLYIDRKTGHVKGDASNGKGYYQTLCTSCHGLDGKEEHTDPLGQIATKNPWEVMHKIQNGAPGEEMPSFRALPIAVTVDILSYMQDVLPKE